MRDFQRIRVYRSETEAFGQRLKPLSLQELKNRVDTIIHSRFFRNRWPHIVEIDVRDGRGRRRGGGDYLGNGIGIIKMPVWTRQDYYILHEIAHVIVESLGKRKRPFHGRKFSSVYLKLVSHFMGKSAANRLREEYKKQRVKYTGDDLT